MKLSPKHDRSICHVTVTAGDNCDTDSSPMVPQVFFRQYQGNFDPETAAVASAILFAAQCGSVAEFEGARIGIDAARAVRAIVPDASDVLPIDGAKRAIGQGHTSIVAGEADRLLGAGIAPDRLGKSARAVTWSGDFVSSVTRDSTRYIGGTMFTNARLVAHGTSISVALALLVGGKGVQEIYVPAALDEEAADFERMARGLDFIGIKLRAL